MTNFHSQGIKLRKIPSYDEISTAGTHVSWIVNPVKCTLFYLSNAISLITSFRQSKTNILLMPFPSHLFHKPFSKLKYSFSIFNSHNISQTNHVHTSTILHINHFSIEPHFRDQPFDTKKSVHFNQFTIRPLLHLNQC